LDSKGSVCASFTCADDSVGKKRSVYRWFWLSDLEGVIMAFKNAYQVKVRVKNSDPTIKMRPPFLEGVIIAESPSKAEKIAIENLFKSAKGAGRPEVTFEKYKVKKLPSQFIYS